MHEAVTVGVETENDKNLMCSESDSATVLGVGVNICFQFRQKEAIVVA